MADVLPYKHTVNFLMKSFFLIMLYTGDFVLRYYVRFSQIRSHDMQQYYVQVYKTLP